MTYDVDGFSTKMTIFRQLNRFLTRTLGVRVIKWAPTQSRSATRSSDSAGFNKIFCVGDNKTGTTTLGAILRYYGYSLPSQAHQELQLTNLAFKTDYKALQQFCEQYDAFQDMPFSQGMTFVVADALFPNSKFILSERPVEEWFNSMCNFHRKILKVNDLSSLKERDLIERFTYLYPGYSHSNKKRFLTSFEGMEKKVNWNRLYDFDWYSEMYTQRNEAIKKYFMDAPDKLLVIDVTNERTTKIICEFLEIPKEMAIEMPQVNKT